jgi:protein-tyrosine-phosphatase
MVPKSVDGMVPSSFDMVISMGCGVHCPAIKIDQDWELEDPVGQAYEVYETTAAEIERRLSLILDQSS